MGDRKLTLIIDTGEDQAGGGSYVTNNSGDNNNYTDFTVTLAEPMLLDRSYNIFIDHLTLSGGRPSLVVEPFLGTWGVAPNDGSGIGQFHQFVIPDDSFSHKVLEDTFRVQSHDGDDHGFPTAEKMATLAASEGPVLQLEIIGITTSQGMETNPYVNATDPERLDLQKLFLFSNTNNFICVGSDDTRLNVHTYTDTTFNYVSTIKATPTNTKSIKNIRFKLMYKWPQNKLNTVFNIGQDGGTAGYARNRAIIEFLFDPI